MKDHYVVQFIIMFIVGTLINPMNILAYQFNHLYISTTLLYSGLFMASNMIWVHELINYFEKMSYDINIAGIGLLLSYVFAYLLRAQFTVDDKQWLKRMIPHHSTALTTSERINKITKNKKIKKLSGEIITAQKKEIKLMEDILNEIN